MSEQPSPPLPTDAEAVHIREPERTPVGSFVAAGVVLLVVVGIIISLAMHGSAKPAPAAVPQSIDDAQSAGVLPPSSYEVIYEVEGTATSADITYTTSSGIEQQQGVDVPLTLKDGRQGIRISMQPGDFVSISAQNRGSGTITCLIMVDAKVLARNTSSGDYAIAACDASLPG